MPVSLARAHEGENTDPYEQTPCRWVCAPSRDQEAGSRGEPPHTGAHQPLSFRVCGLDGRGETAELASPKLGLKSPF